jgi:Type I phosphodiesterase / nucleotide pyrophosphatase
MTVATRPSVPQYSPAHQPGPIDGPVILLEFNELSPALMDTFIEQGYLPNFKRLRDASQVFTTVAEEVAPNLDPWIQWVTVHSGLSFGEHGIFHLGDGHKLAVKSLWDLIAAEGETVWVCGSMNLKYDTPLRGAVVPDPWTVGVSPFPSELEAYYLFVQRNVQEYTNDRVPLSRGDYLRFIKFMVTHGLSFRTVRSIISQLWSERRTGKGKWKRATILDKLQRDVFLHYFQELQPAFSTFFLNSTAHFQHAHWRNMDPEPFKIKPTDADQAEYQHAVRYGYEEMDRIVGDILAAAPANAAIVMATALSQQPCLIYEDIGGKTFYRARTFEPLLEFAGITGCQKVEPVMSEEFHLRFGNERDAAHAAERLSALRIDGRQAMQVERRENNVFSGCIIYSQLEHDAVLEGGPDGKSIPFFRLFYQVESLKSGMHHPDGILWMRIPGVRPNVAREKVSLRDLPPTILSMFGIEKPSYMTGDVLPVGTPAGRM